MHSGELHPARPTGHRHRRCLDPRLSLPQISSAGVERNAIIGDDEVKRMQDIPIVQVRGGGRRGTGGTQAGMGRCGMATLRIARAGVCVPSF